MNTLDENPTQVFCSQCDFVAPNFIEWAGEFYCEEECVAYLPTEASMEEQDFGNPDAEWLASAGWGDDEDYGAFKFMLGDLLGTLCVLALLMLAKKRLINLLTKQVN